MKVKDLIAGIVPHFPRKSIHDNNQSNGQYIGKFISTPVCLAISAAILVASFIVQCPSFTNWRSIRITL